MVTHISVFVVILYALYHQVQGQGYADLSRWQQFGPKSAGSWGVASDKLTLTQTINGNPTFYVRFRVAANLVLTSARHQVSPFNVIQSQITGQLTVETTGDDD